MDHISYQDMSQIFITQAGASMALFPIKLQPHWKNSLIMCEDITGPEDVTITQFTQLSNHQVSNMRHCMISGASPDCSISTLALLVVRRHDLLWLFEGDEMTCHICLRWCHSLWSRGIMPCLVLSPLYG